MRQGVSRHARLFIIYPKHTSGNVEMLARALKRVREDPTDLKPICSILRDVSKSPLKKNLTHLESDQRVFAQHHPRALRRVLQFHRQRHLLRRAYQRTPATRA